MRLVSRLLVVAAPLLVALPAAAQSTSSSSSTTTTSTTTSATARGDLALPMAGGANTGLGYSYNRVSRLVQRDQTSRGLARVIESDLAALQRAQDMYFAEHLTYATSLEQLPKLRVVSGATITLRDVSDRGWSADATHPSLPGSTFLGQVNRAESVTSAVQP